MIFRPLHFDAVALAMDSLQGHGSEFAVLWKAASNASTIANFGICLAWGSRGVSAVDYACPQMAQGGFPLRLSGQAVRKSRLGGIGQQEA